MEINHPAGVAAVILGIISFYGMTYVVIALNTGWRFGYWIAGASFGVLMVLMSVFWVVTALGPRGAEPRWIPLAADSTRITDASYDDARFASAGQYPGGGWQPAAEDAEEVGEFSSSVTNCLASDPEQLRADEQEACAAAQELLPPDEDIPVIEGSAVAMTPELEDVRLIQEDGATLAQARIVPLTRDPRVASDPEAGAPLGDPFLIVALRNEGSIRTPAYASLFIFVVFSAFHLWGLHRAEQRKLSQVA